MLGFLRQLWAFQTGINFLQNHFKDGIKVKFASGKMKSFQSSPLFTEHNWIRERGDEEEVESLGSEENRTWKHARRPGGSACAVKASEGGTANTHPYPCVSGGFGLHNKASQSNKTYFLS